LKIYVNHRYDHHDIVLHEARKGLKPFLWGKDQRQSLSAEQKDFLHHETEYGLNSGITFSTRILPHKFSAITFTSDTSVHKLKNCLDFQGTDLILLEYLFSMFAASCAKENDFTAVSKFILDDMLSFLLEQRRKRKGLIESAPR